MDTYDVATEWIGDPYGQGDSPGLVATSRYSTGVMTDDGMVGGNVSTSGSKTPATPRGNWITGFVTAALIVVALMLIVHHFGEPKEDFKNPKASAYTVFVSALSAVALIPLFKLTTGALATTKLPLTAGLNTYVQAS